MCREVCRCRTGVLILLALQALFVDAFGIEPLAPEAFTRPGTYWWWMGSAVDRQNLKANLEMLQQAGIGGVLVIPIYGVKGYEGRFVEFLSPDWMELFDFALQEAGRLGLWLDMATGTGWPFGGKHITLEHAAKRLSWKWYPVDSECPTNLPVSRTNLVGVFAFSGQDSWQDVTDEVNQKGYVEIHPTQAVDRILVVQWDPTRQRVKRAAPGNEGLVLDPFSPQVMRFYLSRFDDAFARAGALWPRAQYHDSYEYFGANWTPNFLVEFKIRRGYELRPLLPYLLGIGDPDTVGRVKHDYRLTLSELHLETMDVWIKWAHGHGCLTRLEAHGAPANILELYAAADIPETETFGSTPFDIPGLHRSKQDVRDDQPNPIVLRFASSAAHITGKSLVSSETCTWLREHFKTALSHVKPEVDQLFCAGINHISYHGSAYSPIDAQWPGWLFYASVAFQPANTIWHDFPALNAYVQRCQRALQSGRPDNDVLLYWPVHEIWHLTKGLEYQLTVHDTSWIAGHSYGKLAEELLRLGCSFDFISDRFLSQVRVVSGRLSIGGNEYAALILPKMKRIPLQTWWNVMRLAKDGAVVLFEGGLPDDVPGLTRLDEYRHVLRKSQSMLVFEDDPADRSVRKAKVGSGLIYVVSGAEKLPKLCGVRPEPACSYGFQFVRRVHDWGWTYFLANLSSRIFDGWLRVSRPGSLVIIEDPLTGIRGKARYRACDQDTEIYLQLEPGMSCLLYVYQAEKQVDVPPWVYYAEEGEPIELKGTWEVEFIEGGPTLPAPLKIDQLRSWTEFGDPELERFAGIARYKLSFELQNLEADDWFLDLGDVRESARVRLNGKDIGVVWSVPFKIRVGGSLKRGTNVLEVEVTNLAANRIRDLDRRGVVWKRFYDINFVDIRYRPFDASRWELVSSGLLGPVKLIPLKERFVW